MRYPTRARLDDGAHRAGEDRQHGCKFPGAVRPCGGEGEDGGGDERDQRRVRSEDEVPGGADSRVDQQWHHGRVQAGDGGQARRLGVADPDRHEHRRQDKACQHVPREPGAVI